MTKKFETPETSINWIVERIDSVLKTTNEFGELIGFENFKSRKFNEWRDSQCHLEGWAVICDRVCLDTLRSYGVIEVVEKNTEIKFIKSNGWNNFSYRLNNGKVLDYFKFNDLVRALGKSDVKKLFEPVEIEGQQLEVKVYTYGFNHERIAFLQEMRAMLTSLSTR